MIIALLLSLQAAPAASTTAPAPAAPEKKLCRYEKSTGSMMPGKRICHTRDEWTAIDAANQRGAENFRRGREGGALRQE